MKEQTHKLYSNAIIIASLIIAGGLIYNQNQKTELAKYQIQQKVQQEQEKIQREIEKEQALQEEKKLNDVLRNACFSDAFTNYRTTWANACKHKAENAKNKLQECILSGLGESYCNRLWEKEAVYSADCQLSSYNADNINQYHKNNKEECFKKYPIK